MRGRPTPIQSAIRRVLERATTVEPYPVHVGWWKITREVYGRVHVSKSDVRNIQRVAERMWDVEFTHFRDSGRRAGAFLTPTPAQRWIKDRIRRSVASTAYLVEASEYRPATRDEILGAFMEGCREETLRIGLLVQVISLVNKHCGTAFDPSEIAWWRVGLEEERHRERQALFARFHQAIDQLSVEMERREIEARQIDFGPVRIDPVTVTHCPCCRQAVAPGSFPVQRPRVPDVDPVGS